MFFLSLTLYSINRFHEVKFTHYTKVWKYDQKLVNAAKLPIPLAILTRKTSTFISKRATYEPRVFNFMIFNSTFKQ